ncbi:MAG TPA: GxxExxY protein [Vicinamibacterales bacterium]|jgi:GxxExxY protein|nr:GxxExxY protein [Vicinamibacterales bacterium]
MNRLRVASSLPDDLEDLIREVIGCCVTVHRDLGPGLLENVYPRAIAMELDDRGISHSTEKAVPIRYKGRLLCHHRIDLLVDDRLVVEVKSVERLIPVHVAQVLNYLRITGTRAGLLINFNVPLLKQGIRRIVL